MTDSAFVQWLRGVVDALDGDQPSEKQWAKIRENIPGVPEPVQPPKGAPGDPPVINVHADVRPNVHANFRGPSTGRAL